MHTDTGDPRQSFPILAALLLLAITALSACSGGADTAANDSDSATGTAQQGDTSQQQLDATIDPDSSSAPMVPETEPNDGPGQAQDPGDPPVIVTGTGNSANDQVDVYEFTATQDGTLSIVLDGFEPYDLDLAVETDAGESDASSSSTAQNAVEQVQVPVSVGDVVTVTVTAVTTGGLDAPYRLSITYTSDSATAGPTTSATGRTMDWQVVDGCNDGVAVDFRLFDMDADLVWPSNTDQYSTDVGGFTIVNLPCEAGNKICYGATTLGNPLDNPGVGIKRELGCENCCTRCVLGSRPRAVLTCN